MIPANNSEMPNEEGRIELAAPKPVICAGSLVATPPAVWVELPFFEDDPDDVGTLLPPAGGEEPGPGTGVLSVAAGTWDVIATETVGLGAVCVATTTVSSSAPLVPK